MAGRARQAPRRGRPKAPPPAALEGAAGARVEAFLEMLAAERGASANTLAAYHRDLADLATFLAARGLGPDDAGDAILSAYLDDLARRQLSPATAARRLSAVRQFHRFLVAEGLRTDDPSAVLDAPSRGRRLPRYLSEAETGALITAAATAAQAVEATPASALDKARAVRLLVLVELLYATGLRVSELVSLPWGPLASGARLIQVRGKGGKERLVPLSVPAAAAIARYLPLRAVFETLGPSRFLFPSEAEAGHLTRQQFANLLKDLAIAAGLVPTRVSPHVVRHAFASHMLAHGADLRTLQTLLGHADIATTEIYTHVLDERLRALVARHPLATGRNR
jgi:integrase/recombinase XerD